MSHRIQTWNYSTAVVGIQKKQTWWKGNTLTQESTNKKIGVMKHEGYSLWTARLQYEGRTDANLDIIMKVPRHMNYLLSPLHMFILKGLRNLTGGFECTFSFYTDLWLEIFCFIIGHNTAFRYQFRISCKVILRGTVCAWPCVGAFIFLQFHVSG